MPTIQGAAVRRLSVLVTVASATVLCPAQAQGHDGGAGLAAGQTTRWLAPGSTPAPAAPLAARYRMTVHPPATAGASGKAAVQTWHFYRDATQVAVLKAHTEEIWQRDGQGRLGFQRVLHTDQRVIDYSAGELLTLGVQPAWADLSRFAGADELAALRQVSAQGQGIHRRVLLAGRVGHDVLRVHWLPALQLPALLERRGAHGLVSRLQLLQHVAVAPSDWPVPGARAASYLHLDAADFGDMAYDPAVRKAEAMDIKLGWRVAHGHD